MTNHNKKAASGQPKPNRHQLIEFLKAEWNENLAQLEAEKTNIGYTSLTWGEFSSLIPDSFMDDAKQSQIIDLQQRYCNLLERQRQIWLEDTVVDELNKKYAIVHPGQTSILSENRDAHGCPDFSLESKSSFELLFSNKKVQCIDGRYRCRATIWLDSPRRREYENGITFDPTTTESRNGYYNLWKGFACEPKQGNCRKYWMHVADVICDGDEVAYLFVRKWLAYVFQHPDVTHTALVLCGSQGVGKNSFVDPLGVLLGSHFIHLDRQDRLLSHFNNHLKNIVLIHANEALWGGDRKMIGTLKSMVTESDFLIESKGKDPIRVKCFQHLIFSSNEDWPVHLDPDNRRFFVLRVSDTHKEDHEYFKALQDELDNGGYEALLYDLLHEDLTNFDPRVMPASKDSFDIKLRSADSSCQYIYEVLREGGFSIGGEDESVVSVWQEAILKKVVFQDYVAWCQRSNESAQSGALFGRALKKYIISVGDMRPSGNSRVRCYRFPTLRQARADFCKAFKEDPARIFDNDDIEE